MRLTKKVKIVSAIIAAIILLNGYLLLKQNDIILKKYYINDVQFASLDTHVKELEKNAVVTTANEHFIAAPVQSISEVVVSKGQSIHSLEELAIYKEEEATTEMERLESKRDAYETELSELESIVLDLERENNNSKPSTSSDSTTLGDEDVWNVNLSLELGIEQNTPTAEGIAIIQRHIAETQREIDILDSMISQLSENHSLVSPVDGIVEDIILEGDSITFNIHSITKKVVVYVTSEEWQLIEPGQSTSIVLYEGKDEEFMVEGTVLEKQEIPARQSIAYTEMKKHKKIDPDQTIYEVSIEPLDTLEETPIGELGKATITTNEAPNSYEVPEDWIVEYEIENVGDKHIYTLGYDGMTRLVPASVAFNHKAEIENGWLEAEPTPEEEPIEEEEPTETEEKEPPKPRVQTVQLKTEKEPKEEKAKLQKATVFTAELEENQIFLSGDAKNIMAPTFRPYPLQTFSKEKIGEVSWKDVLLYMIP